MSETMNMALLLMGKGMAGIFAVIIVIALIVMILTKITNKKADTE